MSKLIYGVGVNDAGYIVSPRIDGKLVKCPFYYRWLGMLERAYSINGHDRYPTYRGCSVHPDWHTFSTFKSWMELQDWEGMQLDKDLLVKGNMVYSPDTCVFVSCAVNNFILERGRGRGEFPLGVWLVRGDLPYQAGVSVKGKMKYLGRYATTEEAHQAWRVAKYKLAVQLASEQSDPRVAAALIERYKL